jgi:hypothetical protein
MLWKWMLTCGLIVALAKVAGSEPPTIPADASSGSSSSGAKWRIPNRGAPGGNQNSANPGAASPDPAVMPEGGFAPRGLPPSAPRQPVARATKKDCNLPNDAGQELWEYDISPYTARVTSTNRPEQAVYDWILRETGYEAWHGQPLAFMCADRNTLTVYHTPQMQAVVQNMVDRFVNTEAETQAFSMRVVTLSSPDWRVKAQRMLRAISAQSQGVQAWLLHQEDAALVLADLSRRRDFQEHSTPHLLVNNGQSTQVNKTRQRNYIKDVVMRPNAWPGFEPVTGQLDEGFKLEFHPLLSIDGKAVDAILKCEIDQVEKLVPVDLDVSTVAARQQQRIEVPQAIGARLHERFKWPSDQVLLISLGVVPTPVPTTPGVLGMKVPGLSPATRADLLVFVKCEGKVGAQPTALPPGGVRPAAATYQNRYKPAVAR